jgi:hypothetical protein
LVLHDITSHELTLQHSTTQLRSHPSSVLAINLFSDQPQGAFGIAATIDEHWIGADHQR